MDKEQAIRYEYRIACSIVVKYILSQWGRLYFVPRVAAEAWEGGEIVVNF